LPTSLTYIVLSTRGCSPWRPAAVISTTGRKNHSLPRIFKGHQKRTGHHQKCDALPSIEPSLRIIRFQGPLNSLKRKENSSQGSCWRLRVCLCCHIFCPGLTPNKLPLRCCQRKKQISAFQFRNINLIPFRCGRGIISKASVATNPHYYPL
jgi:hypothetical protein